MHHSGKCLQRGGKSVSPALCGIVFDSRTSRKACSANMRVKCYELASEAAGGWRLDEPNTNKSRETASGRVSVAPYCYDGVLTASSFPVLITNAAVVLIAGMRERAEVETRSYRRLTRSHHRLVGEQWNISSDSEGDASCLSIISYSLTPHVVVSR